MKEFLLGLPGPLWLKIIFSSMIPMVEARYAILFFTEMGISFWQLFCLGILGNMIPVPFIILLFRPLIRWLKTTKFGKIAQKLEVRTIKKAAQVQRYEVLGLFLFVAIPVPGTGALTGSMVAGLLGMRLRYALPVILVGAIIATFITTGSLELIMNFIQLF